MLAMQNAKGLEEATEDMTIEKHVILADINKPTKFWLMFPTYLGRVKKGATHISFSYLIWDCVAITPKITRRW
jgi:hypothetical protein